MRLISFAVAGALVSAGFVATSIPSGSAVTSTARQATEPARPASGYVQRQRLADDGETKVTTFRDETGEVVAKAMTDPDVKVELVEATSSAGEESQRAAAAGSDETNEQIELEFNGGSIAGPGQVDSKLAAFDEDTYNARRTGVGLPARSKPGAVFDTGCGTINNDEFKWRGCFERHRVKDEDPNNWYIVDSSVGSGHHEGTFGSLTMGRVAHRYMGSTHKTLVVKNKPSTTLELNCEQRTLSLEAYGVGYSESFDVCPDKIVPDVSDEWANTTWWGNESADDKVVAAALLTQVKMPNAGNNKFVFRLAGHEDDVCWSC